MEVSRLLGESLMAEIGIFLGLPIDLYIMIIRERYDPYCPAFSLKLVHFLSATKGVARFGNAAMRWVIKELPNWYWISQRMFCV